MKKRYAFLTGIAISMIFGAVHAQTLNPDSMLGDTLPAEPAPEVQPEVQPEAPQPMPGMFQDVPITIKCSSVGAVRNLLENALNQQVLAMGFNGLAAQQGSPFDGLVITRNELTKEFTIVLMSGANNAACISAVGTELRLKSEENTE